MYDFTPYGYHWEYSSKLLQHISLLDPIQNVSKKQLQTSRHTYTYEKQIGKGSYGTIFRARSNKNDVVAIKRVNVQDRIELWEMVREIIIQIILYEATKNLPDGPYVPAIYEMAYDATKHHFYSVQELMDGTLESLIKKRSKRENETQLLEDLVDIATKLEWLGTHLKFNHRDFKSDNVMYKKTSKGYVLRLIDFGLSCLTWKHIPFTATNTLFPPTHECYRTSRDLTAILFEITRFEPDFLSDKTLDTLEERLSFSKNLQSMNWENTYNYLNRKNIENPKATPRSIRMTMKSPKHARRYSRKTCLHSRASNGNYLI
jgi:serine/threonine protein kinase